MVSLREGAGAKRGQFESDKAAGYSYYTQLLRKCRNLEEINGRIGCDFGVDAAGTGCSTKNEAVEQNKVCDPAFGALMLFPSTRSCSRHE